MAAIDREIAEQILDLDVVNLVARSMEGKPLTQAQRALIAHYSGMVDKSDVLAALQKIEGIACPACSGAIAVLRENIENA